MRRDAVPGQAGTPLDLGRLAISGAPKGAPGDHDRVSGGGKIILGAAKQRFNGIMRPLVRKTGLAMVLDTP
jgi:hypothetical protein